MLIIYVKQLMYVTIFVCNVLNLEQNYYKPMKEAATTTDANIPADLIEIIFKHVEPIMRVTRETILTGMSRAFATNQD